MKYKQLLALSTFVLGSLLLFSFTKLSYLFGLVFLTLSLFLFVSNKKSEPAPHPILKSSDSINEAGNPIMSFYLKLLYEYNISPYLIYFGILILASTFFIEYFFADGNISETTAIPLALGMYLTLFTKISKRYSFERDFVLFFFILLLFILVTPDFFIKVITGTFGQDSPSIIEGSLFVELFLAKPLAGLFNVLGFNFWSNGEYLYFYSNKADFIQVVRIATGCSGVFSVIFFVAAFTSWLIAINAKFDSTTFILFLLGLILCYWSNLLRMMCIILIGHYWGIDALVWAHANIGWFFFTFFLFLFWTLLSYFPNLVFNINSSNL